jgi:hypothetical protein
MSPLPPLNSNHLFASRLDSDEKMIQQIMDNEAACDKDIREHLAVIACLQKNA